MPDNNDPPPYLARAIFNLATLIVMGLLICGWILRYSDYFPIVGGLLGLGGLFVWIAFLANIISDARKEQIQDTIDRRFLQRRWPPLVLGPLAILFFAIAPLRHGTIIIDGVSDGVHRTVTITPLADAGEERGVPLETASISPYEQAKFLVTTSPGSSREYEVKISGLPALRTTVDALSRVTITPPVQLLERPVALARPAMGIASTVAHGDFKLEIALNNEEICRIENYHGEAVWIAADDDVDVPDRLLQQWRLEIPPGGAAELVNRWIKPMAPLPYLILPPGAKLTVAIVRSDDNGVYARGFAIIPQSLRVRSFPLEVDLDVNENTDSGGNGSVSAGGVGKACSI